MDFQLHYKRKNRYLLSFSNWLVTISRKLQAPRLMTDEEWDALQEEEERRYHKTTEYRKCRRSLTRSGDFGDKGSRNLSVKRFARANDSVRRKASTFVSSAPINAALLVSIPHTILPLIFYLSISPVPCVLLGDCRKEVVLG